MAQAPVLPPGFELPLRQRQPRIGSIDQVGVEQRAAELAKRSIKKDAKLWALELAIRCCDLTTLEGQDTPGKVSALCSKAMRPDPSDPNIVYSESQDGNLQRRNLKTGESRSIRPEEDDDKAPRVAVINEAMARKFWPEGDAIGRRFKRPQDSVWNAVVGVIDFPASPDGTFALPPALAKLRDDAS